jgi:hypothetical protein
MGYKADVVTVMVASPGDVLEERRVATEAILTWNDANADARKLILQPLRWESNLPAQVSDSDPGSLINEHLLSKADIIVAIFRARIGSGGTIEEVELHIQANRPTMLYFSEIPVAGVQNEQEMAAVRKYRERCMGRGIIHSFRSHDEFRIMLLQHLCQMLNREPFLKISSGKVRELSLNAEHLLQAASVDSDRAVWCAFSGNDPHIATDTLRVRFPDKRSIVEWQNILKELIDSGFLRMGEANLFEITESGDQYLKGR